MTPTDKAMHRWKLALDRQARFIRRRRSDEYRRASLWAAAWGFKAMQLKGLMPPRTARSVE